MMEKKNSASEGHRITQTRMYAITLCEWVTKSYI